MEQRTALGISGLAVLGGASLGHMARPRAMARLYGWPSSPWYQRQLASFELAHVYGLALLVRGRGNIDDSAYVRVVSASSLILGMGHFAALAKGDSSGAASWMSGVSSTMLGAAGLVLAARESRRSRRRG